MLLYDDGSSVLFMPGRSTDFNLEEYKKELGKDYKRIVLYLCSEADYNIAEGNLVPSDQEDDDLQYEPPPCSHYCQLKHPNLQLLHLI